MANWLKNKIRKWLGIDLDLQNVHSNINNLYELNSDLVNIGVDVHFKEPHMILIYSRLRGGQIREVSAKFETLRELNDFVVELKKRFNTRSVIFDLPPNVDRNYFY